MRQLSGRLRAAIVAVTMAALSTTQAAAQGGTPRSPAPWPLSIDPATAATGSADEDALLLLQLTGNAPLLPTTIRGLTARTLDSLASFARRRSATRWEWSRPTLTTWYNSTRPYLENDGAVWKGRGLTISGTAGGVSRIGPFSFALRPVAFWTANDSFPRPLVAGSSFANPADPTEIDLPYRFGSKPYGRLDPGESWAQLDTRWIVAGASTATQVWGPMHIYPLLLAPTAGGFPHVLFGTGLPWNVGIGKLSWRSVVGRLDQSAYAPAHAGDSRRLASELVATFSPLGFDNVELGGGRFFHRRWPSDGITTAVLRIPFEPFLKEKLPGKDRSPIADNQLADAFFRILHPRSGVEFYGEFLRDDHSEDINDLVGEPDHESAYAIGLRHASEPRSDDDALGVLTIEMANGRISHLVRMRGESSMYTHSVIVEGHTERGKLLAAPAVYGGGGLTISYSSRRATSGWSAAVRSESVAQDQEGGLWEGRHVGYYSLEVGRTWVRPSGEITVGSSVQKAWNPLAGGNNLELSASFRPGRSR